MGCYHGHGHGHGCWGPPQGDWDYGCGPEPGFGFGYRRVAGFGRRPQRGPLSREAAAAQLEAYLATLRDEVRALEGDLAEMRGSEGGGMAPQV